MIIIKATDDFVYSFRWIDDNDVVVFESEKIFDTKEEIEHASNDMLNNIDTMHSVLEDYRKKLCIDPSEDVHFHVNLVIITIPKKSLPSVKSDCEVQDA